MPTALIAIGQYSSTIETVDAGWCKDITDQGATQIAQSSKSLRYLGLMRCDKVTMLGSQYLLLPGFCVTVLKGDPGDDFKYSKLDFFAVLLESFNIRDKFCKVRT